MSARTQYVYQYYLSKGLPPHVAAGIAANGHVESGGYADDVLTGKRTGDNGSAFAAFQWRGKRFENLQKFAPDWKTNLNKQLDFVLEEVNPNSPYADPIASRNFQRIMQSGDASQAAHLFMNKFERAHPSPKYNHIDQRVAMAQQLYGGQGGQVPATAVANVPGGQVQQQAPALQAQAAPQGQATQAQQPDPFTGWMDMLAALNQQQQQVVPPSPAPMQVAQEDIDPYEATAATSLTPNVYLNRRRRRA